jgi:hypothetical protein
LAINYIFNIVILYAAGAFVCVTLGLSTLCDKNVGFLSIIKTDFCETASP